MVYNRIPSYKQHSMHLNTHNSAVYDRAGITLKAPTIDNLGPSHQRYKSAVAARLARSPGLHLVSLVEIEHRDWIFCNYHHGYAHLSTTSTTALRRCKSYSEPLPTAMAPLRPWLCSRLSTAHLFPALSASPQIAQAVPLPDARVDVSNDRRRSLPDPEGCRAARVSIHVYQVFAICSIQGRTEYQLVDSLN